MKFTQRSIPYRFGLGLSTVSKLVRFFCWVGVDAICTIIISLPSNKSSVVWWFVND